MMPPETHLSRDFHGWACRVTHSGPIRGGKWGAALVVLLLLGGCGGFGGDDERLDVYVLESARNAEQNRDYAAAVGFYSDLLRNRPDEPQFAVGVVRNLRYAGRVDEAMRGAVDALSRFGPVPELLLEKGKAELASNRAEMAVQTLMAVTARGATDWELPAILAVAYDRTGRFDLAEVQYRRALEFFPESPDILNNFALSQALAGNIDEAIRLLQKALTIPAARSQVRENLQFLERLKRGNGKLPIGAALPLKITDPVKPIELQRRESKGR